MLFLLNAFANYIAVLRILV